ncbi:PDZ domain-containing protein [Agrilactobacillus yilanensis]|uniref:PDZ domain-containing protein n=1 Tax=Agrilactobacillus yilanensis TaxID=2485997 RepID=A0ABW4JA80_9LACO|nr:PDZ domain-containing protein [Agrilactobacillus yilanensis]
MFKLITFFLLNPIFWLALLTSFFISYQRIFSERKQFSIAIDNHYSEILVFLKRGLFMGLICSVATLLLGVTVNLTWLSWYVLLTIVGLALSFWFWDSGLLLVLVSLCALLWPRFMWHWGPFSGLSAKIGQQTLASSLVILSLALLSIGLLLARPSQTIISPKIRVSKRGIRTASYHIRRLYLLPLVLLIPGDNLPTLFGLWPFFNIGAHRFTILVLPLILGLNIHLKKRLPTELKQLRYSYFVAGGLIFILAVLAKFLHSTLVLALVAVIIILGLKLYRLHFLHSGQAYLVEPSKGIQVLAVQKDTPAQKAGLVPGDVVLSVNDQPISSQIQFYEMTQVSSTFVKFRVQTLHKDIKLAETAIYKDSPHELGLVTFPDRNNQETRRGF